MDGASEPVPGGVTFVTVAACAFTCTFPQSGLSNEVPMTVASTPVSIKEGFILVHTQNWGQGFAQMDS